MKNSIIRIFRAAIIFSLSLYISSTFAQGWYQQAGGGSYNLLGNFFISPSTGWIVGDGIILKTTNGGQNWIPQVTSSSIMFISVFFVSANTGITVCGDGLIYKTTNGGINWLPVQSPTIQPLASVHFINTNTGWASGSGGTIVKTTNGGDNWFIQTSPTTSVFLYDVFFIDANTGWIAGGNPRAILRTTNGGNNWTMLHHFIYGGGAIHFKDSQTGWLCGGGIYKTTNSGINWFQQEPNLELLSMYFPAKDTGWCIGSLGRIYYTSNGGTNWVQQPSGINNVLKSVFFSNTQTGWVVGEFGRILKTNNGGFTAIEPIANEIPNEYGIEQNYPNPFNPTTKIQFAIPKSGMVTLKVIDLLGREIFAETNFRSAGTYEWNFDGSSLASGVYLYKLASNEFTETKKMMLVK